MKRFKRNEGIATIWAAITMLVLVGFVGLAVDIGLAVWTGQQLQIAADGAALAGAQFVRSDPVRARDQAQLVGVSNVAGGVNVALDRNDGNAPGGDIVFGRFDRDTGVFDPAGLPNSVQATARRTAASANGALDLHFASVLGFNSMEMQRSAIAILGGGTGTGMLILDNDAECALTIRGNPTVNLFDGAIQVNSTNPQGTCLSGNPEILASEINMVGGAQLTGVTEDEVPPLNEYQPAIPDPLADLPAPPIGAPRVPGTISGNGINNWLPGYYPGGIDLSGGTHTLAPGIYILGGKGIDIRGSTRFTADGVMLYILQGPCNIKGSGTLRITPPDPDLYSYTGVDIYEGVAIFQARTNTTAGAVVGSSNMDFLGTYYYFPNNKISLSGTSNRFGNQMIAWSAEIFGNGLIELAVDGSIPAPGRRVFLVE